MTETAEGETPPTPAHELRQLRPVQGRLAGDQYVRVVEPFASTFHREAPGHLVASEQVLRPHGALGRWIEGVRRITIGERISSIRRAISSWLAVE